MCRELAVEICDIVVNKVATQPTEWSLTESRREWRRQESLRTDAICRQIADSLVREICASEAQGIVAEVEAQYAPPAPSSPRPSRRRSSRAWTAPR